MGKEQTLDVRVAMHVAILGRKLCGKRGLKGKNQFPSEEIEVERVVIIHCLSVNS